MIPEKKKCDAGPVKTKNIQNLRESIRFFLLVEDGAEPAFASPLAARDHFGPVVAGFGHHVSAACAFDGFENLFELFRRQAGRHRTDYVFTSLHCFNCHPGMQRGGREHTHRVQFGMLEQIAECRKRVGAAIYFRESLKRSRLHIANRGDLGARVQVPLKGGAETSADNADADGAVRWGRLRQSRRAHAYALDKGAAGPCGGLVLVHREPIAAGRKKIVH